MPELLFGHAATHSRIFSRNEEMAKPHRHEVIDELNQWLEYYRGERDRLDLRIVELKAELANGPTDYHKAIRSPTAPSFETIWQESIVSHIESRDMMATALAFVYFVIHNSVMWYEPNDITVEVWAAVSEDDKVYIEDTWGESGRVMVWRDDHSGPTRAAI